MQSSKARRKLHDLHAAFLLPLFTAAALPTHAVSYGLEYLFLALLYVVRLALPFLRILSDKHGPEDVALTVIIVCIEAFICLVLLGFIIFPDTPVARRIKLVFHHHRRDRHHWTNMRPRHYRRYLRFLRDPLANMDDVHLLPASALHTKMPLHSRSRYRTVLRVDGLLLVMFIAFTRLSSPVRLSQHAQQTPHRPCANSALFLTSITLPFLHEFAHGSLAGGGDRSSPVPSGTFEHPAVSPPVSSPAPPEIAPLTQALHSLLPEPGTSALEAAFFIEYLPVAPDYSPRIVSEPPNRLRADSSEENLRADARAVTSQLFRLSARYAQDLIASAHEAPNTRSVQLAPDIRVPLAVLQPLVDLRPRIVQLQRWHEAWEFVEPYTGTGAEGVTQENQHDVAMEVQDRLATLAHDAPVAGSGAFELSPRNMASFLSTRWFTDEMLNAGLDWITRQLGPHPPVAIANCFFLQWLQGTRASGQARLRLRHETAFVAAIRSHACRFVEFPVHAHGNHWAGIRVDLRARTYSYRDGLHEHAVADRDVVRDIERFLSSVLEENFSLAPGPAHWPMPEQTDSHSCGPLYLTTLMHEYLGGAAWGQEIADMRRMELFLFLTANEDLAQTASPEAAASSSDDDSSDSGCSHSSTTSGSSPVGLDPVHAFLDNELPAQTESSSASQSGEAESGSVPRDNAEPAGAPVSEQADLGPLHGFFIRPKEAPPRMRHRDKQGTTRKRRKPRTAGLFERWLQDGETALSSSAAAEPADSQTPRITAFFTRLTPEEAERRRLAARAQELDEEADRCRMRVHRLELRKLEKKANERVLARNRQRARRQRLKLSKEAAKNLDINDVLGHSMPTRAPASNIPTSERSRPRRDFKIDLRVNNEARGRKRTREDEHAKTINWTNAFLFEQIMQAARESGPRMRPSEIVKILQHRNPVDFATLTPQVLGRYIERPANALPYWKPSVLKRAQHKGGAKPLGYTTRSGFLDGHPELVKVMVEQLAALRSVGVPINVPMARGIMLAHIQHHAPHLLEQTARDGSRFKCSDAFVRKFLYAHLRWVPRTPTRAARKIPQDAEQQLFELFVRLVLIFRDAGIRDAALFINFDQTQVVVADPKSGTYDVEGAKQVDSLGVEEKRAWTAVVGVASDGTMLPTQVVMKGKTDRSLPSAHAPLRDVARDLGFIFSVNPENYWSNQASMEEYFEGILVPYFTAQKSRLGYADDQECVVLLDCWSVHRSKEFRDLVRKRWPWIRLRYVPGGMTGLAQPCDVGIQRPYKLSIRRSQLQDLVAETLRHIQSNGDPTTLKLDTRIGTLRDRSVGWFVNAWREVNHPDIVKKAFEHCAVRGGFNLSFESITSSAALKLVRELPRTDPELWTKIIADYGVDDASGNDDTASVAGSEEGSDWEGDYEGDDEDDTAVLPQVLMESLLGGSARPDIGMAEQLDPNSEEERGRGKRQKTLNSRYRDFVYNDDSE